ncbi:hypothetical protein HDU67_000973, partial [Dinochytrium kinnereticum]
MLHGGKGAGVPGEAVVDVTCLRCFGGVSVGAALGGPEERAPRRRTLGPGRAVMCYACGVQVGFGGVRCAVVGEGGGEEEEGGWVETAFGVEVVCADCESHFSFCTNCGGGGTWRSGKWRPKQLFQPAKQNCTLSHTRVGNHASFRYIVYKISSDSSLSAWEFIDPSSNNATPPSASLASPPVPYVSRNASDTVPTPSAPPAPRINNTPSPSPRLAFTFPPNLAPPKHRPVEATLTPTSEKHKLQQMNPSATLLDMLAWDVVAFVTDAFFTGVATPGVMRLLGSPPPALPCAPVDSSSGWSNLVAWDGFIRNDVDGFLRRDAGVVGEERYVCLALAPSPPPSRRRGRSEVKPSIEMEKCGLVVAGFATGQVVCNSHGGGGGGGAGGRPDLKISHWHMLGRITQDDCSAVRNLFRALLQGVVDQSLVTTTPPELVYVGRRVPEV